ncbi:MAG: MFS transporter [Rhizobiales bacterium]|nr:MFS transporter [Hyphomicrobiales bacterium]
MQRIAPDARNKAPAGLILVLALGPFAAGYFLSYLYRAVNAVVAPDLTAELGLSAGELGLLTAAYLFGFAGFQIPLGVLLDRYGPRRVQTGLICIAATGALVFAIAGSAIGLSFGRMLIGIGSSGGLMAGFKAVAIWVRPERRAFANAVIMATGGLGIMMATVPAEWASQALGWRGMFFGLVVVTVAVAALIFVAVPEKQSASQETSLSQQLSAIAAIYRDAAFWRVAPLVATTCGSHIAIQTLWAGPWLKDNAGLDRNGVAETLGIMAICFLIGTLTSGAVADWLGRRGIGLLKVMIGFAFIYLTTLGIIVLQPALAGLPVWIIFAMFGQAGVLSYPWLAQHFGLEKSGRANTALNFLVFTTAFACQYLIGVIIDLWPLTPAGGYDTAGYQVGFGVFLAIQLAGLGWYLLKPPVPLAQI